MTSRSSLEVPKDDDLVTLAKAGNPERSDVLGDSPLASKNQKKAKKGRPAERLIAELAA